MDGNSYATLYLGGRGVWTNNSDVGTIVAQGSGYAQGSYSFEDGKSRELRLDFRHGPNASALLRVMWQSTSTPISDIPSTAFNHYVNVTHANLTITPAALCSRCSTAFGKALSEATAGVQASFIVLARDKFGNLLQVRCSVPNIQDFDVIRLLNEIFHSLLARKRSFSHGCGWARWHFIQGGRN
jgi:hypothetical protein